MERQYHQYIHQPLKSPRSIRVLHLESAALPTAALRCSLAEVSLDDLPEYWALSYSWDAQTPSYPIACGSDSSGDGGYGTLYITLNCVAALREIRHTQEQRTLWIDSICINQGSIDERNEQVAKMGEIYRNAQHVIVWLGEKDSSAEQAMRTLAEIGDRSSIEHAGNPMDTEYKRSVQRKFHARAEMLTRGKPCDSNPDLRSSRGSKLNLLHLDARDASEDRIGPLFTRSWFHRMWTIQEVVLSKANMIVVVCGDVTIQWIDLVIALDALEVTQYRWGQWKEATKLQKHLSLLVLLKRYPGKREIVDNNPGDLMNYPVLSHILMDARSKASADPRDKVFAIYGVLEELGVQLPAPDYRKPVEEVYTEAAAACIRNDKNLFVLFQAPSDHRRPGLPSWVPDWSDAGWGESDQRFPVIRDRFAAGGAEPSWNFSPDSRRLTVLGKVFDSIVHRAAPFEIGSPPSPGNLTGRDLSGRLTPTETLRSLHSAFEVLKSWVILSTRGDTYPSGETVKEALQRTLVNDVPENNADANANGAFDAWYRVMTASDTETMAMALQALQPSSSVTELIRTVTSTLDLAYNSIISTASSLFTSHQPSRSPSTPTNQAPFAFNETFLRALVQQIPHEVRSFHALSSGLGRNFHGLVLVFSNKKCFYSTEKGYFGTAADMIPDPVQVGDKIAVIAGLEMPVVLRPVENGYRLITHCYLHGVMYGEAWPEQDQSLEQITLL